MTSRAAFTSSTVPAPIMHPLTPTPSSDARSEIASSAPGVVSVISTAPTPPAATAAVAARRFVVSGRRTTAITPLASSASVTGERPLDAGARQDGHPACCRRDELRDARRLAQRLEGRAGEQQVRSRGEREVGSMPPNDERHDADPELLLLIRRNHAPLVLEPRIREPLEHLVRKRARVVRRKIGRGDDLLVQLLE